MIANIIIMILSESGQSVQAYWSEDCSGTRQMRRSVRMVIGSGQ